METCVTARFECHHVALCMCFEERALESNDRRIEKGQQLPRLMQHHRPEQQIRVQELQDVDRERVVRAVGVVELEQDGLELGDMPLLEVLDHHRLPL